MVGSYVYYKIIFSNEYIMGNESIDKLLDTAAILLPIFVSSP